MRYSYEKRNLCYKVNEKIPVSGKRFLKCTNIEPLKVIQNQKFLIFEKFKFNATILGCILIWTKYSIGSTGKVE